MENTAKETTEQFIEKVKLFLEIRTWTDVKLAKSVGVSQGLISQFLQNKYPGDVEKIKGKITNVMNRESDKDTLLKSKNAFIETSISKRYIDVARACHLSQEIGVVYSQAGLGKTISAREYEARNSDVILIEVDPGYTPTYFLQKLHSKLRLSDPKKCGPLLLDECVEKLKGSARFIIIDEAEQLPYKALEIVRRLNDNANVGILLAGMHKLLNNLRGIKDQYAQLFSRIGMAAKLEPLTEKDTRLIVASNLNNLDNDLWQIFHKESAGITRRLYKIIARSTFISQMNNVEIDEEVVQTAANLVKIERMN